MRDPLRVLILLVQFKKREKQPWRSITLKLQASACNTKHSTTTRAFFYVFQIVQMALNRAKHLICDDHIAVSLDSFFLSRF